jgi:hypothetical protein
MMRITKISPDGWSSKISPAGGGGLGAAETGGGSNPIKAFLFCLLLATGNHLFSQDVLHEKIFVHTDKNYYQTGDIIWFKIYNVEEEKIIPASVSKLAYVEVLDSVNKPVLQARIRLDSGAGNGSFFIPANIATGTYVLRSYTNWMKNFGPEHFFEKDIAIVNAAGGRRAYRSNGGVANNNDSTQQIQLSTNNQQYGKRQKVKLFISSAPSAELSVSVYRLDSLVSQDPADINCLLTKNKTADPDKFPFPPEYEGHFVNGRMISRNTRMPSKNVVGYLTVMDDANAFYNSRTNNEGKIKFLVTKLNSSDSIIVQTHSYYDRDQQIDIESPFYNRFSARKASTFIATEDYPATVLEQSINTQVTQLYYQDELNKFKIIKTDSTPFYLKEDMRYVLDDFTRFSRLEDVFREYVRPVGVTKRQGSFHLTVFTESNRYLIEQEPLVLVDAVPVFDMNTFFTYDPLKVKTIDVVQHKYFRSGAVFPGIISLKTFRGRTDGQMIDPNANVLAYEIVQKQRKFYSPSYDTTVSAHMPDFRSTLYWNPSLRTGTPGNAEVEFFTSDLEGEFIVCVRGLSSGKTIAASMQFAVQ